MKYATLILITHFSVFAQQSYIDSVSYSFLLSNTSETEWIYKFSNYPKDIDSCVVENIKRQFENFDQEYFNSQIQFENNHKWDKDKIGDRKLKGKGLPIINWFPRKKAINYLSRPVFLNKNNKVFLIYTSYSSNLGFSNDWSIYKYENGVFEFFESVESIIGN